MLYPYWKPEKRGQRAAVNGEIHVRMMRNPKQPGHNILLVPPPTPLSFLLLVQLAAMLWLCSRSPRSLKRGTRVRCGLDGWNQYFAVQQYASPAGTYCAVSSRQQNTQVVARPVYHRITATCSGGSLCRQLPHFEACVSQTTEVQWVLNDIGSPRLMRSYCPIYP